MLDARYLVACRAVVFSDLRFNYYPWIEFVWNNKIGRLIESNDLFGPPGHSIADPCPIKSVLDCEFEDITHKLRNGIPVSRERPTKKPFV